MQDSKGRKQELTDKTSAKHVEQAELALCIATYSTVLSSLLVLAAEQDPELQEQELTAQDICKACRAFTNGPILSYLLCSSRTAAQDSEGREQELTAKRSAKHAKHEQKGHMTFLLCLTQAHCYAGLRRAGTGTDSQDLSKACRAG